MRGESTGAQRVRGRGRWGHLTNPFAFVLAALETTTVSRSQPMSSSTFWIASKETPPRRYTMSCLAGRSTFITVLSMPTSHTALSTSNAWSYELWWRGCVACGCGVLTEMQSQ